MYLMFAVLVITEGHHGSFSEMSGFLFKEPLESLIIKPRFCYHVTVELFLGETEASIGWRTYYTKVMGTTQL